MTTTRSLRLSDETWAALDAYASWFMHTTGRSQSRATVLNELMRLNPPQEMSPFARKVREAVKELG